MTASTQNQALSAILFLYKSVLNIEVDAPGNFTYAKKPKRLPTVFSREEVKAVLAHFDGIYWLMAFLLYGAGLRLMECLRLRIKDIDFDYRQIVVRAGKGDVDRKTMLPERAIEPLRRQIEKALEIHAQDLKDGFGEVYLPNAFDRKFPGGGKDPAWQYVFPSKKRSIDPRSGKTRRHHLDEHGLQRAVKRAIRSAGICKKASCHTFRHSFGTHLMEDGYDIRTVQTLMGHKDVRTTEIYTHVLNKGGQGVISPGDRLG